MPLTPWTPELDARLPGGDAADPLQLPPLDVVERPAVGAPGGAGAPAGVLVLLHGRGADEHDLFPLLETLDPHARLHGVCPGAPFAMPGEGGRHWYRLGGVGRPHRPTFEAALAALRSFLAGLEARTGVPMSRTVVGGFSQGCVMATAATLMDGGLRPAALLGMSGFLAGVEGRELDPTLARDLPTVIAHGTMDPVIDVRMGMHLAESLAEAGARVAWEPSPMSHSIDPSMLVGLRPWIEAVVDPAQVAAMQGGATQGG